METHTYPHLPSKSNTIHLSLFHNVRNSTSLRSRLITAATSNDPTEQAAVNFAFIDAKTIACKEQLLNACVLAILAEESGNLKTRTVHSEVLWTLMPGTNISDSLRKIGISNSTTDLVLVQITSSATSSASGQNVLRDMIHLVQGDLDTRGVSSLDDTYDQSSLRGTTDWTGLKKLFKLADVEWPLQGQHADADAVHDAQALIASLTAIKNVS